MNGFRSGKWAQRLLLVPAIAGLFALNMPPKPAQAMMQNRLNDVVIRFCDRSAQSWTSYTSPNDPNFIHQEIELSQGEYTLKVQPAGNFRVDGYVYQGSGNRYIGGARNVYGFSQDLSVPGSSERFLVQLVKTLQAPGGVTMTLQSRNCPGRSSSPQPLAPVCRPNYCMTEPSVFGLSQQCIPRQGAKGGVCGTPGN